MSRGRKLNSTDDALAGLPGWAQKLARKYYTRTVSTFLLYGAVRDLQPLTTEEGARAYGPLRSFLTEELFGGRDHVLFYDRSSGVRSASPETQKDLARVMSGYDAMYGTDYAKSLPRDPGRALQILENYLRMRLSEGKSLALVIDFAETLVPGGELSHLSAEDRFVLATLEKWSHDPQFLAGDVSVVLLAENLADMNPRLARNPYVATIELPLPNEEERLDYVRFKLEGKRLQSLSDVPLQGLARMTAGLSRIHLDRILTEALEHGARITPELLKERKKEIIQAECHGLLEFIEPAHTLDAVAGHAKAKERLRQAARALKGGHQDVLPMGYLLAGPVGTGKTFLVSCFAGEIGIPVVKFLNFRSQWQGVTEANLEKIFNLLKALWPVAVMIDEADTFLGNRDSSGDSGTSSRIFGSIAAFMGNTQYRGKIVWFLMTARPDLLPIDLKRQGRAEEHLALFYPQTDAERDELFRVVSKKTGVSVELPSFASLLPESAKGFSGADIEAVLVRARFLALAEGRSAVSEADLRAVLADFVPPSYPLEIELQNLAAVQECTSRELLPEAFRSLDRDAVTRRIRELKALLEEG
ncbi:ATP-binding protein [Aggregicoccus sp. 17bor-14]|uniref:ATP-binding protein n=1 Tax=Myxococcaceae TaxID=31 RepID=UPI00129CCBF1|nr:MULTISPECIES: AAA family ATPase [Myxococcaceae]MBF5044327.1 ATP-binding protein [Simulacricoccus sp. 17bor-14]MRI90074.1 ATP-binding protein [Aggregicoccus sp. 17bor-14]